ncbi:hypothetical protein OUZ56_018535 [Daphnia magna]|uniref:Uncharacterized protein n=1 Tax=Daphnia magna TaxID=35525 RepID=A0ABQ9Z941_9CRUS|nr:hypothetical protein OUZ56_018535 [Daphnia magna]
MKDLQKAMTRLDKRQASRSLSLVQVSWKLQSDLELGGNEINGDLHRPIGMAVSYLKFLKISFILNDASHCQIDV